MDLEDLSAQAASDLRKILPQEQDMPKAMVREAQSFDQAPGYREIGMFYTCVPDVQYPWDPTIMKEIWRFAPDAIPMWVQWVFLGPKERGEHIEVFGRHALGRKIWHPNYDLTPFHCEMPSFPCQGLSFEKPNYIWFVHEGAKLNDGKYKDLPGNFLGFDDSILRRAKDEAVGFNMTEREFIEFMRETYIEKPRLERERRLKALEEDMAARDADFEKYARGQMDKISDVEIKEFQQSVGKRGREKKPTIIVP